VASSQTTKFEVKIEEAINNEEFVMRPRTRSRVRKNAKGTDPQEVVEISEDKKEEKQENNKEEEVKKDEPIWFKQGEDPMQYEQDTIQYEEEDPKC